MLKRIPVWIFITLLVVGMSVLAFYTMPVKGSTITVPDDYPTIQEAINNANSGDIVFVRAATYYENIILNVSISLVGEARETTIVDARGIGNPLEITANRTVVSGFTFSYGIGAGVAMTNSHKNLIQNNIMRKNSRGIEGSLYTNTILENNIVTENEYGVGFGHLSGPSSSNNIARNNEVHHNTQAGFYVSASEGNGSIVGNNIHDNFIGIVLDHTQNNNVSGNLINYNTYGIYMRNAIQDTIAQNQLQGNVVGVHLETSNSNTLFHNSFVSNTAQVEGVSYNIWDNDYPSGGNYWSGYSGLDLYNGPFQNLTGSDGIGDNVYKIDTDNTDNYPLMYQWPDLTPPITENNYDDQWHLTDFEITLTATDSGQGVAETYYRINGGPTETVSFDGEPMITTESASNTLEYWSTDNADNEELPHKILTEIRLDKTPPAIGTPNQSPSGIVDQWQEVRISANITDVLSDVRNANLFYTLTDDVHWQPLIPMGYNVTTGYYDAAIPGQPGGVTVKFKIVAYDNAGNMKTNDKAGEYYIYSVIPEFPSLLVLSIFMMATLLAVIVCRKTHREDSVWRAK